VAGAKWGGDCGEWMVPPAGLGRPKNKSYKVLVQEIVERGTLKGRTKGGDRVQNLLGRLRRNSGGPLRKKSTGVLNPLTRFPLRRRRREKQEGNGWRGAGI